MADAGDLAKVDGDIFYAADVDKLNEVNLNAGIMGLGNFQKLLYSTAWSATESDSLRRSFGYGNCVVDGFASSVDFSDTTNTTACVGNERTLFANYQLKFALFNCLTLILCNDGDYTTDDVFTMTDGGIQYFTGGYTINGSGGGQGKFVSDGTNEFDIKSFSGDTEIIIGLTFSYNNAGTTAFIKLIDNDANEVTLKTFSPGAPQPHEYRIKVDKSAEEVFTSENAGDTWSGAIDISSMTGTNWYLKLEAGSSVNNDAQLHLYFIGYVAEGETSSINPNLTTPEYHTRVWTFEETKLRAACSWTSIEPTAKTIGTVDDDITVSVSANNGANYDAATKGQMTTITNTGTQCKIKVALSPKSSGIDASQVTYSDIDDIMVIGGYFDG